jgi:hypothetical protein
LERTRGENLFWKIIRVEQDGVGHHYAIVVRHPSRLLDLGIHAQFGSLLKDLSQLPENGLLSRFEQSKHGGFQTIPLTIVEEEADYWLDKDWTLRWVGDAMGIQR